METVNDLSQYIKYWIRGKIVTTSHLQTSTPNTRDYGLGNRWILTSENGVFLQTNKSCLPSVFLISLRSNKNVLPFKSHIDFQQCLLACSLLVSCLCGCIATLRCVLPLLTVDQWNSVRPWAAMYVVCPGGACVRYKHNGAHS